MPLKDRLRKLVQIAAVGTTMFAPAAFAQDLEKPALVNAILSSMQQDI